MSSIPNDPLRSRISALAMLSDAHLEKIFGLAKAREVAKGEDVLRHGQVCKHIFFVKSGYLRTFTEKDGLEINTGFTFENGFTTNLKSLRTALPSDSTIQAGELASVYEFNKDELLKLYTDAPEIESFGRKLLEQLLIAQEEHANLFRLYTSQERYNYLQKHHPHIIQRVSLSQISSYLGVARETISRIRKSNRNSL